MLYARGFRGPVYATKATSDLSQIMLRDSAHIQQFEAEWRNRKAQRSGGEMYEPLYTMEDALGAVRLFVPCPYNARVHVCDEVTVRFTDVGHLLGSSSIEVFARENGEERTIVFSGDLGNSNKPILKDPTYTKAADYVVMESTYGDRLHDSEEPDYVGQLAEIIQDTFKRGGNVVVPCFAVGRTQEMLYFIRQIKEQGLITVNPDFEVYVDSPLAVEATNIFGKNVEECFDDEARELVNKGINPIGFPGLKLSVTSDDSKEINFDMRPKVILSASGMCEAGRIRHHLKHNLWRADSTIVFVGFQVPGTLGHSLLNGVKEVKLFGEQIEVHAKIMNLPGLSGHADKRMLTEWIKAYKTPLKRVFIVHGDDEVCDGFAAYLREELGLDAVAPYSGDTFDLVLNQQTAQGSRDLVKKKTKSSKASSNVFARLLAAGERLLAVIQKNEGTANKDMAKFADQINALCEKWDR